MNQKPQIARTAMLWQFVEETPNQEKEIMM